MGVSTDASAEGDLHAIYQGGENFLARMKAMSDQKAAIERMLTELNLGRSASDALADAKAKQEAATATLAAAKSSAQQTTDDATKQAQKLRGDADAYVAKVTAEIAENQGAASSARQHAEGLKAEAAKLHGNIDAVHKQLQGEIESANKMEARFNEKISVLHTAMEAAGKL